jgi:MFS family permease
MTIAEAPSIASTTPPDTAPARWRMLALLSFAVLLGMSVWFTGSAVAPELQARWSLSTSAVGWLTTAVQLGFVVGTALSALLNLADLIPGRRLFAVSALIGALSNAALAFVPSVGWALVSRALVGCCMAGVYPPAMKMASTWFRARRGLAVGTVVGALTVGKAGPYLAQALPSITVSGVVAASSFSTFLAAVVVWFGYRDGPYAFPSRVFSWTLVSSVMQGRRWRLATGGYLGHMAELYSYWTWIPAFLLASAEAHGDAARHRGLIGALSFGVIAVGGIGCVWGGLLADRIGRERLVIRAMAISGSCAALIGVAFGRSWWVLAPLALVWGFFVIADSAQFSVLVTESVPPNAVGTALTIQTSLGFLLTTITIQLVPIVVRWLGWGFGFAFLSIGPMLGIVAIRRLQRPSLST